MHGVGSVCVLHSLPAVMFCWQPTMGYTERGGGLQGTPVVVVVVVVPVVLGVVLIVTVVVDVEGSSVEVVVVVVVDVVRLVV
mmetsp:Transcript_78187/g.237080  ORF Transcript_78187/g.237080 Transcript_78187/m.237080 type:complete len:82 (+) Transcript_78187:114-359(+)